MELNLLNLLLVLLSAWVAGSVVARFGYPAILGELLAGIILGPPLLGLLEGTEVLAVLAEVGVLLMMLYIGMEIDPKELFKASWGGFLAAIGGFITPFVLTYLVVVVFFDATPLAGLFVGIAAGVTSLATKSRILADLHLLDTRIAHVMMAGALVADSLSLVVFAGIISVVDLGSLDVLQLVRVGVEVALFFGVTVFLGLKVFPVAWKWLGRLGLTNRTFYATFLLLITLLFAEMAELAGLHAILGAFLAGLFIREGVGVERRLALELTELVRDVSIGFLAPIFFVSAGFLVSLDVFVTSLPLLASITVIAMVGKIAGTMLFYLFSGNGWREGMVIGAGMNGRGAVEIIIAEIALTAGIITQEIFSALVFMAIFTTATVPIFLKWGVDWLQRRGELLRTADQKQGVVIVGASPAARTLATALSASDSVWLIDNNKDRCERAQAEGLNAVHGDALDAEDLQKAQIGEAGWFFALTGNTETNILAAQLARNTFSVPEIHVLLTGTEKGSLLHLLAEIGAHPIHDNTIHFTTLNKLMNADDTTVETVDIDVKSSLPTKSFMSTNQQDFRIFVPLTVLRNGHTLPFLAQEMLEAGDTVKAAVLT